MKIFKRTVSLFLAFCLCAGMLLLQPQSTVSAAVRNKPTTTVLRMSSNSFDSSAIYVNLPKAKVCYIKNIKTSKQLKTGCFTFTKSITILLKFIFRYRTMTILPPHCRRNSADSNCYHPNYRCVINDYPYLTQQKNCNRYYRNLSYSSS